MMSQCQKILEYLQTHDGITSLEAIRLFGCTRLSGRIYDLRKRGYDIDSRDITVPNRDGKRVRVTQYRLMKG